MAKKKVKITKKVQAKKANTSKKTTTKSVKLNFSEKLSLVIPCYNESGRLSLMVSALKRFDRDWIAPYEVIVVDDGSTDDTAKLAEEKLAGQLPKADKIEVIKVEQNQGKGNALKVGVAAASGDFILTLDADMATSPMELKKWLRQLPGRTFNSKKILIGSREHKGSKVEGRFGRRIAGLVYNAATQLLTPVTANDTQCGFKLYPAAIGKTLFSNLKTKGFAHDIEILYQAQLEGIEVKSMPVNWQHVEDEKISVAKDGILMFFQTLLMSWRIKFNHFFVTPFQKSSSSLNNNQESPIFKFLFAMTTLFLLFFMPYMSVDYGITGDEYAQKIYGELIVKHFESDGTYTVQPGDYEKKYEGQSALTMVPNLYYYGGFFDYVAAKLYMTFDTWDPYTTRHGLNALTGFFLIFFTGLLGKELTGSWKMGFLALVFAALSPRIFGHAMNNPKDIPFAAAYIFTLLHIIRLVKQLPNPGFKSMFWTAVGIALAISIRIGGLLLVGLLGLFIGVAFLWRSDLRKALFGFKMNIIGGVATKLFLIILVGYFGGLMFWPYGLEDWLSNPLEALGAMSNFSTGIQMLFEGEHLWSDDLPWYYIPKWIYMSSPIVVLFGMALTIILYFKYRDSKNELPILMVFFAGVFPFLYILYQGSALYDGMRHLLFIYPVFVVMGAYGWSKLDVFDNKMVNLGSLVVVGALLLLPLMWIVKSHPYQYTYFNELSGGIEAAKGEYETDYWMNSSKNLSEWFVENVVKKDTSQRYLVGMPDNLSAGRHYFNSTVGIDKAAAIFLKYDRRDQENRWNYLLTFNRFKNEGLINSGAWPPGEVIYEEKVNGVTLGAITKRASEDGKVAQTAFAAQNYPEAIRAFKAEVQKNPKNETAWIGLANTYERVQNFDSMKVAIDKALELSNTHITHISTLGRYHFNKNELDKAIEVFNKAIKVNKKQTFNYYYLALAHQRKQEGALAVNAIEQFAIQSGNIPQAYDIGIQLTQMQHLKLFFQAKKAYAQRQVQQAYQLVSQAVAANKNYQPAVDFKTALEGGKK